MILRIRYGGRTKRHRWSRRPPLHPEVQAQVHRLRNMILILDPPSPTLWERLCSRAYAIHEVWCRHVTQREVYRRLDQARYLLAERGRSLAADSPGSPGASPAFDTAIGLDRLRADTVPKERGRS